MFRIKTPREKMKAGVWGNGYHLIFTYFYKSPSVNKIWLESRKLFFREKFLEFCECQQVNKYASNYEVNRQPSESKPRSDVRRGPDSKTKAALNFCQRDNDRSDIKDNVIWSNIDRSSG